LVEFLNHILWVRPSVELAGDISILYLERYHFIFRNLGVFEHKNHILA